MTGMGNLLHLSESRGHDHDTGPAAHPYQSLDLERPIPLRSRAVPPAPREILTIAGQASVDDGRVLHDGDHAAQLSLTVHHIEEILAHAG
ncbi:hypothetical protein QSJ19_26075 [Gordonia sp. ABSL11-1]|uniref:hypothetical protein n=1 Tax=Gordonia sp. ABSL11-1 TaxID=3053924 RepID=UPI002573C0E9|nr:hypothetical protein [Gordonia sp. ABSL11-1]MDL9948985.1 hypothetical protein [Gordonia sp. ABSL11-1]